jgi:uncharacterized repeat protein (TIGR03803 family)
MMERVDHDGNMMKAQQHRSPVSGIFLRITTATLLAVALVPAIQAQTFSVLYSFQGQPDGAEPTGVLILDAAENLYGTTPYGGTANLGTAFKLDQAGKETILHDFTEHATGLNPSGGLTRDAKGNLYDTAAGGPKLHETGMVFRLTSTGIEKILYHFRDIDRGHGYSPNGSLVRDSDGNLYGTTAAGGSGNCNPDLSGCGMVYKLESTGSLAMEYDFSGGADGGGPSAGVIRDTAGNLYGTTIGGGSLSGGYQSQCDGDGCGVVFKVDPTGVETVLYTFTGKADGAQPYAGLIQDSAGNLYGTAHAGGDPAFCGGFGCGVIFKLNPSGVFTVLHKFTDSPDGEDPVYGSLVRDSLGNLYGTTLNGGSLDCPEGCGTVFKLDKHGNETILYTFTGGADGSLPLGGLVRDKAGNLYGMTTQGGVGFGVVFKITP